MEIKLKSNQSITIDYDSLNSRTTTNSSNISFLQKSIQRQSNQNIATIKYQIAGVWSCGLIIGNINGTGNFAGIITISGSSPYISLTDLYGTVSKISNLTMTYSINNPTEFSLTINGGSFKNSVFLTYLP